MTNAEYHKNWRKENPERFKEIQKKSYIKNFAQKQSYAKEYYLKNKVRISKRTREYALNNPEIYRIAKKKHYCLNRDKQIADAHKRRVAGGVVLTREMVQLVYERNISMFNSLTCCLCKKKITFGQDSLEHLLPISRGGTNHINNLDVSHRSCNYSRGDKTIEEYNQYLEAA